MVDVASPGKDGTGETYDLDNVTLTEGAPTRRHAGTPAAEQEEMQEEEKAGGGREEEVQEAPGRKQDPQRLTTGASTSPSRQRS